MEETGGAVSSARASAADTGNREYTKHFALARKRARGQAYSPGYPEYFHSIGPDESEVESYIQRDAAPLCAPA